MSKTDHVVYPNASKGLEIALYYGFSPTAPLSLEKVDHEYAKDLISDEVSEPKVHPEDLINLVRNIVAKNQAHLLPVMLIRERKATVKNPSTKPGTGKIEYALDIIGTNKSIADATVMKTAYEMLRAEGYTNLEIELNSIGDKESFARFTRELGSYFRKHLNELHAECKQLLKKSPLLIMTCKHAECQSIKENAPHPMSYLSELSRIHFKEVLEILETLNLPYSINGNLITSSEFGSHTTFQITGTDENAQAPMVLCRGVRFTGIAKRIGLKKDMQGISAVLCHKKPTELKVAKLERPQFYFVQMGQEAKVKSLIVIDILRQARIPVYHSLTKDKLTAQLMSAENLKVPYILIMGQKESIENTVLVREMSNRCQETIKITIIAEYLKKLI